MMSKMTMAASTESNTSQSHIQVKFFTKQPRHSIADSPYSLPSSVTAKDLNNLVNTVLDNEGSTAIKFDFLIDGEFLLVPLDHHITHKELSLEDVIEIEYLESHSAPKPDRSLQHDDWVSSIHSTPHTILSGCYDNSLRLWNVSGSPIMTIPAHAAPVKCVSWITYEADGTGASTFVSGGHDQTLYIWRWDVMNNEIDCLHACRGHAGSVDCVAVNHSHTKFCSGSWDKMLKLWSASVDVEENELDDVQEHDDKRKKTDKQKVNSRVPMLTLSGHTEGISAVQWMDETSVCTASWDHTIRLWDLHTATHTATLQGAKVFLDISYSPQTSLLLSASADRHIRSYDPRVKDGAVVSCVLSGHQAWVSSVQWSPIHDHQFLSGSYDCCVKLWDYRSPKAALYDLKGHEDKVMAVNWSVPHLLMSGGADNHLKIFKYQELVPQ